MTRYIWFLFILFIIVAGILIISQRNRVIWLGDRLRQADADNEEVIQQNGALQQQVSELLQQREKDRALISQFWLMAQTATTSSGEALSDDDAGSPYEELAVRKLIESSGGNLGEVVKKILTPNQLQAILEKHPEEPAYWAAAALLQGDPNQVLSSLEQAVDQYPECSMVRALLVNQQLAGGQIDETTLESIQALRSLDPNNALTDHFEAYFRFQQGDAEGAIQALAAASDKDRFADHRLDLIMAQYHCLLESGCSDGMALGLSAFTVPFSHLGMFREVGEKAIGQAEALLSSGNTDQAVQISEYLQQVGRNLSASGRFLVYDQVGIGLQQAALDTKKQIYESAGNAIQVQEVNYQLGAIQARSAQIADMANRFGAVLANMSEADITRYIDGTILNGEYSTLQTIMGQR